MIRDDPCLAERPNFVSTSANWISSVGLVHPWPRLFSGSNSAKPRTSVHQLPGVTLVVAVAVTVYSSPQLSLSFKLTNSGFLIVVFFFLSESACSFPPIRHALVYIAPCVSIILVQQRHQLRTPVHQLPGVTLAVAVVVQFTLALRSIVKPQCFTVSRARPRLLFFIAFCLLFPLLSVLAIVRNPQQRPAASLSMYILSPPFLPILSIQPTL
jgi:hypothetical protein